MISHANGPVVIQRPAATQPAPASPTPPATVKGPATAVEYSTHVFTKEDVSALTAKRSELSRQLSSAQSRRNDAEQSLRRTNSDASRAGIEKRLAVLDDRIIQIENDISANGRELAAAPGNLVNAETAAPVLRYGPFTPAQLTGITIVSIVMVWGPLAVGSVIIAMRRWGRPRPAPQILESAARLERMEQAVDAVAIEVERISEGQRFVTQILAKREPAPALGVGQAPAEPIRVSDAATVNRVG